jgi:hypothetical protein
MTTLVSIWLVLVLAVTASLKAWRAAGTARALATYGISGRRAQWTGVWLLVSTELGLALALAAGLAWAPAGIAGLLLLFAGATLAALLAGGSGRPCACFGSASRLGWSSPVRAAALALVAGALALGWLPGGPEGYDRWLTLGLSLSLAALAGLAVAVLALAREVGVLRLSAGSRGALEIAGEGPELGSTQPWAKSVPIGRRALLVVAIFTSESCPLCAQLAPAVEHLAGDPLLAVGVFDEHADAAAWSQAAVPGSPYAVVLSVGAVVLANGTFNSLSQLETVLATARSRERGLALAA